tara:strand:- start:205 stop:408 length:204 start_codon:yes stop_codon:yes gene_type:complete
MKVGDLVMSAEFGGCDGEGIGIVMEPPRLSYDCMPGGDADGETYYMVKVLWASGIEEVFEDDCEVIR